MDIKNLLKLEDHPKSGDFYISSTGVVTTKFQLDAYITVLVDTIITDAPKYTGTHLYLPNATKVQDKALYDSVFTGELFAPKLKIIEDYAFYNSRFIGSFVNKTVISIGVGAFYHSMFTGNFAAKLVAIIKAKAFYKSTFNWLFSAPKLKIIGIDSFYNSIVATIVPDTPHIIIHKGKPFVV